MAIRVEQTPLVIESFPAVGHLRVNQASLILESVSPPSGHLRIGQSVLIIEAPSSGGSGGLLPSVTIGFQDPLGNPLAFGKVSFQISAEATASSNTIKLTPGYVIKGNLDSSGNLIQPFPIWPNALLTPNTTYYKVKAFSAGGQLVWYSPVIIPNTYPTVNLNNIVPQQ